MVDVCLDFVVHSGRVHRSFGGTFDSFGVAQKLCAACVLFPSSCFFVIIVTPSSTPLSGRAFEGRTA